MNDKVEKWREALWANYWKSTIYDNGFQQAAEWLATLEVERDSLRQQLEIAMSETALRPCATCKTSHPYFDKNINKIWCRHCTDMCTVITWEQTKTLWNN